MYICMYMYPYYGMILRYIYIYIYIYVSILCYKFALGSPRRRGTQTGSAATVISTEIEPKIEIFGSIRFDSVRFGSIRFDSAPRLLLFLRSLVLLLL